MYYFDPNGCTGTLSDYAIVDTSRGVEFGKVCQGNKFVSKDDIVPPLRPVIRIATENDIKTNNENKKKEAEALKICQQKIAAHGLEMKLVESEYTFDGAKLTFYFTADGRIDFRELVKDLASTNSVKSVFVRRRSLWAVLVFADVLSVAVRFYLIFVKFQLRWQKSKIFHLTHLKFPVLADVLCVA